MNRGDRNSEANILPTQVDVVPEEQVDVVDAAPADVEDGRRANEMVENEREDADPPPPQRVVLQSRRRRQQEAIVIEEPTSELTTFSDLLKPDSVRYSEDTHLIGRLLVIKKHDKPLNIYRPSSAKRKIPDPSYHTMALIGERGTSNVIAVVAKTAAAAQRIFNTPVLHVGAMVRLEEPVHNGMFLGCDKHNPIIEIMRPIRVLNMQDGNVHVPISYHAETTALKHFCLNGKQLIFGNAEIMEPTCQGVLCDRRQDRQPCSCLQTPSDSGWCASFRIMCDNADESEAQCDIFSGSILQSFALSKIFMSPDVLGLPVDQIQRKKLRAAVRRVEQYANVHGGFTVGGFTKSAKIDEESGSIIKDVKHVKIVYICPAQPVPENLKYCD